MYKQLSEGVHMVRKIYILGGAQTDFSRNLSREQQTLFDLFKESVLAALEDANLTPKEIEVGHIGNFVAELFSGQGMLGGFFGHVEDGFYGLPSSRHEGACASGSLAILAALPPGTLRINSIPVTHAVS